MAEIQSSVNCVKPCLALRAMLILQSTVKINMCIIETRAHKGFVCLSASVSKRAYSVVIGGIMHDTVPTVCTSFYTSLSHHGYGIGFCCFTIHYIVVAL